MASLRGGSLEAGNLRKVSSSAALKRTADQGVEPTADYPDRDRLALRFEQFERAR
jgi:hypothetical protein